MMKKIANICIQSIKMHIIYSTRNENISNKQFHSSGPFSPSLKIYKCMPFHQNTAAGNEKESIQMIIFTSYSIVFSPASPQSFFESHSVTRELLFRSIHISIIHTAVPPSPPQGGLTPASRTMAYNCH